MKKIGHIAAAGIILIAIAALAFVWWHQSAISGTPQLLLQWLTLRLAAIALLVILVFPVVLGPRWTCLPFAVVLHYSFLLPLFAFGGKSPFRWMLHYAYFEPVTTGEYVTGRMEVGRLILWHRFGLTGIIAVLTTTLLLMISDILKKKANKPQERTSQ